MGYDKTTDIIEAGVLLKLITKAGAFYTLGDQKFQGKEKLSQFLESDSKALSEISKKIEGAIKEMRMGKKVLDEEAFDDLDAISEELAGIEISG